jgi:CheY-like chemotaxis protein
MSHVLLIDDSKRVREIVRVMLESAGFDVSIAIDGVDGINQFREDRFDVVLSDVVMPRKDGPETIREIRDLSPDIPIIAMSGGTHFSDHGCGRGMTSYALCAAEEVGATRTISKPFPREELLNVIRESVTEAASRFF